MDEENYDMDEENHDMEEEKFKVYFALDGEKYPISQTALLTQMEASDYAETLSKGCTWVQLENNNIRVFSENERKDLKFIFVDVKRNPE